VVRAPAPGASSLATARQLASEIFVLGFPLLLMDAIRRAHPLAPSGFHRFSAGAQQLVPGLFVDDPDCLHTSAVVDLALNAAVLHLPNTHGRYLSVTLFDSAGEPFASLGSHSGDVLDSDVLIAAPHWHGDVASGLRALRAPCEFVWAVSRLLARSAADRPQVQALAARQYFAPAGARGAAAEATRQDGSRLAVLELMSIRHLTDVTPAHQFHRLVQLIDRAPPDIRQQLGLAVRTRLALLGASDLSAPDAERDDVMRRGFADGWKAISAAQEELAAAGAGEWRVPGEFASAELSASLRAALALERLGAPVRQDILSLRCKVDETGRPLTGAERYRIRFTPASWPPALAGWRLTAEDAQASGPGQVIGDHSPLVPQDDGTLELRIQKDPPRHRGANWLGVPDGRFELTLRLYDPAEPALRGVWRMPRVERLGSRSGRPDTSTKRRPRPLASP
jgi:hypothetical protein